MRMKVLCLPDGLPIDYTIQLANALSTREDVMIITHDNLQAENMEDINQDIKLHIALFKHPLWYPANFIKLFYTIREVVKYDPDIIHVQGGDILAILIYVLHRKCALITTFHDVKPHPGWENKVVFRLIRSWFMKKSKKIFVHGDILKKVMIQEFSIPQSNVYSIPMGEHNVSPFRKYIKEDIIEENSILFFGWIEFRKGLEYLIKAEPIISKEIPNTKIIIAGKTGTNKSDGEYFKKCQGLIVNNNNFEIHNSHISWKFGAELFQRASIVVLPYVEVSQSGVISTAYGFKKPVVVTNVGAMPEIVDEGITGLIVPSKDPEALAKAIIKLLKNDKLRKDMGECAYHKLKTELSWDSIAETTIEVYKEARGELNANS